MLKNMKIGTKLILAFVLIGIIPLAVIGVISMNKSTDALKAAVNNQLISIRNIKAAQISGYFDERAGDIEVLSSNPDVIEATKAYTEAYKKGVLSAEYRAVDEKYSPWLIKYEKEYGYYDLFVISPSGDIVYTVEKEPDFATNVVNGKYSDQNIADLFRMARTGRAFVDFDAYAPSNGDAASFVGAPVMDNGKFVGVVALQIPIGAVNKVMQERSGLGESGETYLIGPDFLMRSDSRFSDEPTILKQKCDHESIRLAINSDKTGVMETPDYRGVPVVSAYMPIEVGGMNWALIAEIDVEEMMRPVKSLQNSVIIIGLIIAAIIAVIGWLFSKTISTPIIKVVKLTEWMTDEFNQFVHVVDSIANNDLTQEIKQSEMEKLNIDSNDEIGTLVKAIEGTLDAKKQIGDSLTKMTTNLDTMVRQLTDNARELVSAATEIASSSEQMAQGAKNQTDQATQVSSAIEEMSATIVESSKNANEAREVSESASTTSNEGQSIVGDTISGMVKIAESTTGSGQIIGELAQASDRIGEIIGVIDDIADQTNLLALNAAIEAARAGEQGRGFAVVADEVRKLAERTGKATGEITDMIKGIQSDSTRAVTSMEEAGKLVDDGKALADKAGNSLTEINSMSQRVTDMIIQIATAADQQSAAAEQISKNMEQITTIIRETATGAEQSASAAEELNRQAEGMQQMIGQFKLKEKV